jgi:hypothetical protein
VDSKFIPVRSQSRGACLDQSPEFSPAPPHEQGMFRLTVRGACIPRPGPRREGRRVALQTHGPRSSFPWCWPHLSFAKHPSRYSVCTFSLRKCKYKITHPNSFFSPASFGSLLPRVNWYQERRKSRRDAVYRFHISIYLCA